eukprot:130508_1
MATISDSTNKNTQQLTLQIEESKSPDTESVSNEIELLRKFHHAYTMHTTKLIEEQAQRKANLKVGSLVDLFSTSRNQWLPGKITQFEGDAVCILYGRKIKWLHKNSRNYRARKREINALPPTLKLHPKLSQSAPLLPGLDICEIENDNAMTPSFSPSSPITPIPPINDISVSTQHKQNVLSENTYEYDVTFYSTILGLSTCQLKDSMNCMVKACLSDCTKKSVNIGSLIIGVNGKNVYGMSYQKICEIIKEEKLKLPMNITFRSRINGNNYSQINNINERCLLQIKVLCAMQLKVSAKYVGIKVGNALLNTKLVNKSHHPEWNEVLLFKNFRCNYGKKAYVTVYDTSLVLKDKKIGTAEIELPVKFNSIKKHTLDLIDDKGKIAGVILINTICTPQ